jgi:AcrR family transcriptional regulator
VLDAAKTLHAKHGILATSWEAIAREAGVATATAYRHFPSLAELLPACADSVFNTAGMPTPEQATAIFEGARTPAARLERLIRGTCECYLRGEGWLNAARRERELVPAVRDAVERQRQSIETLVRSALAGSRVEARTVKAITALIDFPFWRSLSESGLGRRESEDLIVGLVRSTLASRERRSG